MIRCFLVTNLTKEKSGAFPYITLVILEDHNKRGCCWLAKHPQRLHCTSSCTHIALTEDLHKRGYSWNTECRQCLDNVYSYGPVGICECFNESGYSNCISNLAKNGCCFFADARILV